MKVTLQEALKGLKNAVCDLTSLEVQTYVGEIQAVVKGVNDSIDFGKALEKAETSGAVTLTLVTKLNFDGDGVVLVPENAPANYIQEAHDAAILAGNEIRQGIISLFSEVVGLKK